MAIDQDLNFPLLVLIASGGHTRLYILNNHLDFKLVGDTLDDAIGEAYDKVGRMLGLNYPAGPQMDKIASVGDNEFVLPIPKNDKTLDFSFSGLKSSAANIIDKNKNNKDFNIINFAASFQSAAISSVLQKVHLAIKKYNPRAIGIAGGVSANSMLRSKITRISKEYKIKLFLPKMKYCGDNAAMISQLAYYKIRKGN